MRPNLFFIVLLCLMSLILSCGDDEEEPAIDVVKAPTESSNVEAVIPDVDNLAIAEPVEDQAQEPEVVAPEADPIQKAIDGVLQRMRDGYEKEDLDLYLSAFWIDGFRYTSDMATAHDRIDDEIFDEFRQEAQSAARVFARFQDIGLQILSPAKILSEAPEKIEVMTHYRIQAFANDGHALEGGFLAWYAEGDARFTFELRDEEWRITEWLDEAFDPQEILFLVKGVKPKGGLHPAGKLATIWGIVKVQF